MSNICEYKEEMEECKIGFQQSTVIEILAEFDRLKLENEMLKSDNSALIIENEQLRNDNNELHNIAQNQIELEILKNDTNNQGGWSEEETLLLSNVYAEMDKDFKF